MTVVQALRELIRTIEARQGTIGRLITADELAKYKATLESWEIGR